MSWENLNQVSSFCSGLSSAAPSIAMARMANAFIAFMTMAAIVEVGICADHIVGAPSGSWNLQTNFSKWASSQKFLAGDNLIFVYGPTHDVLEVNKGDYGTCTTTNPLSSDNSGNTSIALTAPGTRYFICGTPMHCPGGMKIAILISSPSSPPPVHSPPAPTSSSPVSPAPTSSSPVSSPPPVTSPPPPQKSAASAYDLRVQIAVAFGLGLAVLVLLAH